MKVKLLKKIRSRYSMTFNPNIEEGGLPYKCTIRYNLANEEYSESFKTKEEMFKVYRRSVLYLCAKLYFQCKKNRDKPLKTIKHCQ